MAGPGSIKIDDPTLGPNDQGLIWQGIVIEKNCWIGHGVSILDGATLGEGSVIGAAVLTQTIPRYSIAVGVPAKVIKRQDVQHELVND
ncbi:MAG: hypothetical protein EA367_18850 [Leptolyngbya sp. DLM2.Bin15]|nr:MAG: hypothetical protein EA367_18850 [Leptolyngbya sp. DLM2.Bin15]